MATGQNPAGLQLTEEEAMSLLLMCLMSPHAIDRTSESALRKLAEYCANKSTRSDSDSIELFTAAGGTDELEKAGA